MRNALPFVLLATALVPTAVHAQVCDEPISEPFNYFTFAEPFPAPDSTDVPRDAALILRGNGYGIGGSPIIFSWFVLDSVTVTDVEGNVIPGRIVSEEVSQTSPAVSWMPDEPFAANVEYHVAASLEPQDVTRPEEAEGSETLEFQFTTGATNGPELTIEAPLEATITTADLPIYECDDCGSCTEVDTYEGLVAKVTIPAVSGGTDVEGYRSLVYLSDTEAIEFDASGRTANSGSDVYVVKSVHLTAGVEQQIELPLPAIDEPYVPCFTLKAYDPGLRRVTAMPICLDAVDPPPAPDTVFEGQGGAGGAPPTTTEGNAGATDVIDTAAGGEGGSAGSAGSAGELPTRSEDPVPDDSADDGPQPVSDGNDDVGGDSERDDTPTNRNEGTDSASSSSGCSIAAPAGPTPAPLLGLSLLGLLALTRRRRSKE